MPLRWRRTSADAGEFVPSQATAVRGLGIPWTPPGMPSEVSVRRRFVRMTVSEEVSWLTDTGCVRQQAQRHSPAKRTSLGQKISPKRFSSEILNPIVKKCTPENTLTSRSSRTAYAGSCCTTILADSPQAHFWAYVKTVVGVRVNVGFHVGFGTRIYLPERVVFSLGEPPGGG